MLRATHIYNRMRSSPQQDVLGVSEAPGRSCPPRTMCPEGHCKECHVPERILIERNHDLFPIGVVLAANTIAVELVTVEPPVHDSHLVSAAEYSPVSGYGVVPQVTEWIARTGAIVVFDKQIPVGLRTPREAVRLGAEVPSRVEPKLWRELESQELYRRLEGLLLAVAKIAKRCANRVHVLPLAL